jgi:HK97 family phage prohead protease
MNKIFNLTSTFKAAEADDGSVMIRGMASTADFDRAGDTISAEAWTKGGLQNFEKNPIILFNHDYDRPIGRATGMKAGPNGLELECKISKNAPGNVAELVKDGVLGAFSVGFKVKDADYLKETDGLMIKDAELFEVSVVSVPCNQAATFSLAKSFDSDKEYEEFKKTFTNRVDLAGQSLAKDEDISSNIASDHTPKSAETNSADQEIKMDNQNIDLEAFAKKVAEDTAAKIAMKQAEQKAADEATAKAAKEADEAKALEAQSIKSSIQTGIESGVEKLQSDMQKEFAAAKEGEIEAVVKKYEAQVAEQAKELEAMRTSKKDFSGRKGTEMSAWGNEFLNAKILGAITGKGYDTDYAKGMFEKAGVDITYTGAGSLGIDNTVINAFQEKVRLEQRVAGLFNEINVTSGATVLPLAPDTGLATFGAGGIVDTDNTLTNSVAGGGSAFATEQVILRAFRLVAGTFLSNDTDEQTIVAMLPMIQSALARAHARAMDSMCLVGASATSVRAGLVGKDGVDTVTGAYGVAATGDVNTAAEGLNINVDASDTDTITAGGLLNMRQQMGKFGMNPQDVAYILPTDGYLQLIDGPGFTDVTEVGSDLASKITGLVGTVFGSPVISSDILANQLAATDAQTTTAACAVNVNNYVIPRLAGVNIESEYSAANQRTALVASQSVGFNQIEAGTTGNRPVVRASYV